MDQITIKIKPEIKKILEDIAAAEELSVSDVVRRIIKEKIKPNFFCNKSIHLMTRGSAKNKK